MRTPLPDPFVRVSDENIATLQNVLGQRLPLSAHEYNMILYKRRFGHDVQVYTLDEDLSENAIVLFLTHRKDWGQDINISISINYVPNDYLKKALIATEVINWNDAYCFVSIHHVLTSLIANISTSVMKNSIQINPNYQYVYDAKDVINLTFRDLEEGIEMQSLDKIQGAKFLLDNWKYTMDGSMEYVQNVLEKNPSAGVFLDGKLVSGALVNVHGLIGLLYTDPTYRQMGYAKLCMRYVSREMAKIGMIPCSTSQSKNNKSCNFHEKLGLEIAHSHETAYIYHFRYSDDKHFK